MSDNKIIDWVFDSGVTVVCGDCMLKDKTIRELQHQMEIRERLLASYVYSDLERRQKEKARG